MFPQPDMREQAGVSELIAVAAIPLGEHACAAGSPVPGKAGGGPPDVDPARSAR